MRSKLNARNAASAVGLRLGHADVAGAVDRVEHRVRRTRRSGATALAPDDVGDLVGQIVRAEDAGAHRVVEVVAHVRDAIGPGDHLTFGRGRRGPPPRVVAHAVERLDAEVQRRERDVGAVDGVVVAAGHVRRERLLRRVAGRTVPAVVRERDRLGERDAEAGDAGDAGGDLRDLDRVREPGAEVIVFGRDEHLALAREPAPRTRVLDAVEIALEAQPVRIGLLGARAVARADRPRRAGREASGRARARASLRAAAPRRPTSCRRPHPGADAPGIGYGSFDQCSTALDRVPVEGLRTPVAPVRAHAVLVDALRTPAVRRRARNVGDLDDVVVDARTDDPSVVQSEARALRARQRAGQRSTGCRVEVDATRRRATSGIGRLAVGVHRARRRPRAACRSCAASCPRSRRRPRACAGSRCRGAT